VRSSSLVDWPVYPRLAHTMRASDEAQCGARPPHLGSAPSSPPDELSRHSPGMSSWPKSDPRRWLWQARRASLERRAGRSRFYDWMVAHPSITQGVQCQQETASPASVSRVSSRSSAQNSPRSRMFLKFLLPRSMAVDARLAEIEEIIGEREATGEDFAA
jgi:hypothetical protein